MEDLCKEFRTENISEERKKFLDSIIYKTSEGLKFYKRLSIICICTHNFRRSIFAQVWAQTMASYFGFDKIKVYSGGTEQTAVYPSVIDSLQYNGFLLHTQGESQNPITIIKAEPNADPIILFSKITQDFINPKSNFYAWMTCSEADKNCPIVFGAEIKVSLCYEDPKFSDGSPLESQVYSKKSHEIGQEMWYIFKNLKSL